MEIETGDEVRLMWHMNEDAKSIGIYLQSKSERGNEIQRDKGSMRQEREMAVCENDT